MKLVLIGLLLLILVIVLFLNPEMVGGGSTSTGTMIQLSAVGAQDMYLSGSPADDE